MKTIMRTCATWFIILLASAICSGCSTLYLEATDGSKIFKMQYTRKISGLQLTKATIKPNSDGSVTATIEGVKSDNQAFMETINTAIGKIPGN